MLITLSSRSKDFRNSDHDGPKYETARFQRQVDQRTRLSDDRTTSEATGIARSNRATSRTAQNPACSPAEKAINILNRNSMIRIQRPCDQ
ncbi:hypothetical protein [Kitasatospora sp. NPDC056184]|uniref:hypothetical protein n=1 Tax=Kitasatospora sp. NPDC056184 TaxID=3345738 RepID=UPI0035E23869